MSKVTCLLCHNKPAKKLEAKAPNGGNYVSAERAPVFCSARCAKNWALIEAKQKIDNDELHWCQKAGEVGEWSVNNMAGCCAEGADDPFEEKEEGEEG